MTAQEHSPLLGELMLKKGLISHDQLRIALTEQAETGLSLGHQIIKLGFVSATTMRDIVANSQGHGSIDLTNLAADQEALNLVPQTLARQHHILPVAYQTDSDTLTLAMADTFNLPALDHLRATFTLPIKIQPLLAEQGQLEECIDQFYGYELSVDGILHEIETGEIDYTSMHAGRDAYTHPIVRLVGALLMDAVKHNASDIHFEPEQAFLRIRYRVDGVLQQIRSLHKHYWGAIAVRLKVMSGLNIAETRSPQDGRLSMHVCGRPIDFRVSSHPTLHGENIVLRILDREKSIMPIEQLGLSQAHLAELSQTMNKPEGIVIFTGPTGSGKTTMLYSLLSLVNTEAVNIMTLEDPVEYPVSMMRQTSVTEANKVDFANGIRSIMRQDPDIILVGEIRDEDTASMAFRAAMTGHQVFTTLHTNSALGVFSRLYDIGVLPDILAGNIIAVVAQRLIRTLCPHCKIPHQPSDAERALLKMADADKHTVFKAAGCDACLQKGYRGRMAIMEVLRIDSEMDTLIARRAHLDELEKMARNKGFITLAEDGLARVIAGHTSLVELMRVVDLAKQSRVPE